MFTLGKLILLEVSTPFKFLNGMSGQIRSAQECYYWIALA
jgi:hypothetical protein